MGWRGKGRPARVASFGCLVLPPASTGAGDLGRRARSASACSARRSGATLLKTFSLPGTESERAFDVLEHEFARKGDTGDLVFKVRGSGDVNSPAVRNEIEPVFAKLRHQPHVVTVTSPVRAGRRRFVLAGARSRTPRSCSTCRPTTCRSTSRRTCARIVEKANTPTLAGRARRLDVHRPDAARERGDRHPRRGAHPVDRVRVAARDGSADHDRAVRHRHRARVRHPARARASTSRRSRRRSPR